MYIKEMVYSKEHKIELIGQDEYKGYNWYIFNLGTHPTAYVEVPKKHRYYKKNHNEIDIYVHGSLTYSGNYFPFFETNCNSWFIGWDYAHYGDYVPFIDISTDHKWTTAEITVDCMSVIDQLVEAENDKEKTTD